MSERQPNKQFSCRSTQFYRAQCNATLAKTELLFDQKSDLQVCCSEHRPVFPNLEVEALDWCHVCAQNYK